MSEAKIDNAKIESVSLGSDDHGGITCWLHLDYGARGHQGFGGYDLRWWGGYYLQRLLEVLDVDFWEKLPGNVVRVRHTSQHIEAIGHATEDRWFEPGSKKEQNAAQAAMKKVTSAR